MYLGMVLIVWIGVIDPSQLKYGLIFGLISILADLIEY